MRNKIIMLIAVCFAVCLFPNLGEAQHHGPRFRQKINHQKKMHQKRRFGRQHNAEKMLEALEGDLALTEKQKSELENLRYEFKKTQIDQQAEVKKAGLELRHLKRDKSSDKEAVMNAIDDVANAKAEMQKLQYSHKMDMRSVFTEEQLEELEELKSSRQKKMLKRKHKSGGQMGI